MDRSNVRRRGVKGRKPDCNSSAGSSSGGKVANKARGQRQKGQPSSSGQQSSSAATAPGCLQNEDGSLQNEEGGDRLYRTVSTALSRFATEWSQGGGSGEDNNNIDISLDERNAFLSFVSRELLEQGGFSLRKKQLRASVANILLEYLGDENALIDQTISSIAYVKLLNLGLVLLKEWKLLRPSSSFSSCGTPVLESLYTRTIDCLMDRQPRECGECEDNLSGTCPLHKLKNHFILPLWEVNREDKFIGSLVAVKAKWMELKACRMLDDGGDSSADESEAEYVGVDNDEEEMEYYRTSESESEDGEMDMNTETEGEARPSGITARTDAQLNEIEPQEEEEETIVILKALSSNMSIAYEILLNDSSVVQEELFDKMRKEPSAEEQGVILGKVVGILDGTRENVRDDRGVRDERLKFLYCVIELLSKWEFFAKSNRATSCTLGEELCDNYFKEQRQLYHRDPYFLNNVCKLVGKLNDQIYIIPFERKLETLRYHFTFLLACGDVNKSAALLKFAYMIIQEIVGMFLFSTLKNQSHQDFQFSTLIMKAARISDDAQYKQSLGWVLVEILQILKNKANMSNVAKCVWSIIRSLRLCPRPGEGLDTTSFLYTWIWAIKTSLKKPEFQRFYNDLEPELKQYIRSIDQNTDPAPKRFEHFYGIQDQHQQP